MLETEREQEKAAAGEEAAAAGSSTLSAKVRLDPAIVKQIHDMGFSLHGNFSTLSSLYPLLLTLHLSLSTGSERAALACQQEGLNACIEWAILHSNDVDFDQPSPLLAKPAVPNGTSDSSKPPSESSPSSSSAVVAAKKGPKARPIPLELQRLFAQLQLSDRRTLSTDDLTSKGFAWQSWDGRVQHDVHELVRLLIDALERSLVRTTAEKLLGSLYRGKQVWRRKRNEWMPRYFHFIYNLIGE